MLLRCSRHRAGCSTLRGAGMYRRTPTALMRFDKESGRDREEQRRMQREALENSDFLDATAKPVPVDAAFTPYPLPVHDERFGFEPEQLPNVHDIKAATERMSAQSDAGQGRRRTTAGGSFDEVRSWSITKSKRDTVMTGELDRVDAHGSVVAVGGHHGSMEQHGAATPSHELNYTNPLTNLERFTRNVRGEAFNAFEKYTLTGVTPHDLLRRIADGKNATEGGFSVRDPQLLALLTDVVEIVDHFSDDQLVELFELVSFTRPTGFFITGAPIAWESFRSREAQTILQHKLPRFVLLVLFTHLENYFSDGAGRERVVNNPTLLTALLDLFADFQINNVTALATTRDDFNLTTHHSSPRILPNIPETIGPKLFAAAVDIFYMSESGELKVPMTVGTAVDIAVSMCAMYHNSSKDDSNKGPLSVVDASFLNAVVAMATTNKGQQQLAQRCSPDEAVTLLSRLWMAGISVDHAYNELKTVLLAAAVHDPAGGEKGESTSFVDFLSKGKPTSEFFLAWLAHPPFDLAAAQAVFDKFQTRHRQEVKAAVEEVRRLRQGMKNADAAEGTLLRLQYDEKQFVSSFAHFLQGVPNSADPKVIGMARKYADGAVLNQVRQLRALRLSEADLEQLSFLRGMGRLEKQKMRFVIMLHNIWIPEVLPRMLTMAENGRTTIVIPWRALQRLERRRQRYVDRGVNKSAWIERALDIIADEVRAKRIHIMLPSDECVCTDGAGWLHDEYSTISAAAYSLHKVPLVQPVIVAPNKRTMREMAHHALSFADNYLQHDLDDTFYTGSTVFTRIHRYSGRMGFIGGTSAMKIDDKVHEKDRQVNAVHRRFAQANLGKDYYNVPQLTRRARYSPGWQQGSPVQDVGTTLPVAQSLQD